MVLQALMSPGDIVIVDRNCHKSHHYGMVLSGAQPLYVEAFPMTEYSMYGAVPLRTIKQALLASKREGRLDRVKMVDLTNCTFDGHVYNTRRVMEECLAIKPDLIFLWDEAWFGSRDGRRSCASHGDGRRGRYRGVAARPGERRRLGATARRVGEAIRRMKRCSIRSCFRILAKYGFASTRPTRRTSRCRRCGKDR